MNIWIEMNWNMHVLHVMLNIKYSFVKYSFAKLNIVLLNIVLFVKYSFACNVKYACFDVIVNVHFL